MPPEPDGTFILCFCLTLFSLLLCALYAAGESALENLSLSQLKKEAESGNAKSKTLLKTVEAQTEPVSPMQTGLLLWGFLGLAFAQAAFWRLLTGWLPARWSEGLRSLLSFLLVALLYALLFFILCDLLPKKGARHNAKGFSRQFTGVISGLSLLAKPFLSLCSLIVGGLLRLARIDPHSLDDAVTEEEILQMVGEGEEKGVIEETEKDMIRNILDFNDTTAGETMTHRTDIVAVEDSASIEEVVEASVENGCSRVPVFHEDIDTVVGICYVKDLLPYVGREVPQFITLTDLMRPAYFIPESKKCSQLFTEMTERKVQIAIVVDEYGGTAGLITLEDLMESIVGNIQDEYDHEEEEIHRVSETEFTVDGATSIDEISDLTGISLPEGDYDTIAGLVTEQLGRIPKEGEHPQVQIGRLSITVLEIEDQRLSRLLLVKEPAKEEQEDREEK